MRVAMWRNVSFYTINVPLKDCIEKKLVQDVVAVNSVLKICIRRGGGREG